MRNLKRNAAIAGAAAVLAALGVGGTVAAHASSGHSAVVQKSDGDGEAKDSNEANEASETEGDGEAKDANEVEGVDEGNQGPDANPNEPGHQDADETGETGTTN